MRMLVRTSSAWRLGALWFGLQLLWGAILGVALQSRIDALAGSDALMRFAQILPLGALIAAITQLGVGIISDRRRRLGSSRSEFYILGTLIAVPAVWVLLTTPSLGMLTIAFVALQLGANIATGPLQTTIAEYIQPARYGVASAAMGALQSLGNAVGAIVASQIADERLVAATIALALVGSCAITVLHVRQLVPLPEHHSAEIPIARDRTVLFVSRAFLYLGLYSLLGYAFFFVHDALALSAGLSVRASGILLLAFTIGGALGAVLAGRPADRLDRRVPALAGGGLTTLSLLVLAFGVTNVMSAWAWAALAGIGWGALLVADWAIATRMLPPTVRATAMGIWNLAVVVPQMLAPLLAAALISALAFAPPQASRSAFALASLWIFCGTVLLARIPQRQAPSANESP